MPAYDYKCECGKELETFIRLENEATTIIKCDCGKVMERQLHAPAVFFKCTMPTPKGNRIHKREWK